MNKYPYIVSIITLAIAAALGILVTYWLLNPYKIIEFESPNAITVDKRIYRPGDRIAYTIKYCKYDKVKARITRGLVNSIRIDYPTINSNFIMGCDTTTKSDLIIPDFVDGGVYHLEAAIEYEVNPIRTVHTQWRSVDFIILK